MITVLVKPYTVKWYEMLGYVIPEEAFETKQMYGYGQTSRRTRTAKNGVRKYLRAPYPLSVLPEHVLDTKSKNNLKFTCPSCAAQVCGPWREFHANMTMNCKSCREVASWRGGKHRYWAKQLIDLTENSKCDISGETDKRFLELHHLLSKSNGGKDEPSNYLVLSCNYHRAFHLGMGGMNVPCTPEDYAKFKKQELEKLGNKSFVAGEEMH